jgi:hypothetical protein
MYVWITGSGDRYFPGQLVTISGVTSDGALPLHLKRFSAGAHGAATQLQWQTANEQNLLRFEVEKSEDGRSFKSIGVVAAHNSGTGNYSFNDPSANSGVAYYRLKMVNKDGSFSYSYVVVINNAQKGKLFVFPNPASQIITVKHEAVQKLATATVFNIEGRKLMTIPLASNSSQTSFSIEQLPIGNYLLQYVDEKQVQTVKFSKQ